MKRPRIKIELEPIDRIIEAIGVIGLILLIGLPIFYFSQLPEIIPTHFNAKGEPDGFNGKASIWLLPICGFLIHLGLFWINKYPHKFNFPQKLTEENAEKLYRIATRMTRVLNTIILLVFAYLTYSTIQIGLENQNGLGPLFLPIFILLIIGTIGYFTVKSMK